MGFPAHQSVAVGHAMALSLERLKPPLRLPRTDLRANVRVSLECGFTHVIMDPLPTPL